MPVGPIGAGTLKRHGLSSPGSCTLLSYMPGLQGIGGGGRRLFCPSLDLGPFCLPISASIISSQDFTVISKVSFIRILRMFKNAQTGASEILRSAAYLDVRRNRARPEPAEG